MRRREFMQRTGAVAGAAAAAAHIIIPAHAQGHKDTLLTVSESGPNSLDVQGIGSNPPGYEASWNTYDRLLTFGVKKDENGNDYYDHSKIGPELAESWDLADMSASFKLRREAKFHDGTAVTAKDVKMVVRPRGGHRRRRDISVCRRFVAEVRAVRRRRR
jgi:peptide/nickel transport system substrate-binding protein